ncbi:MAG: hypothetical protein HC794_08975 [Nitrospiraceae bacterium]|nr:hypothetical protein [Nitrospiraceae bacterium]
MKKPREPSTVSAYDVVERRQDVAGRRVVAVLELVGLEHVAGRAIARGDHGGDHRTVVVVSIGLVALGLVAVDAADARGVMMMRRCCKRTTVSATASTGWSSIPATTC